MPTFQIHTIDSAPEASQPALQGLPQAFGLIPNVAATMAGSPALINAFVGAFKNFHGGSFDERERQIVLLTNAVALGCHWTIAFHSTIALKAGVDANDVAAIRGGGAPADVKLASLSGLARALVRSRGLGASEEVERFVAAGYDQSQIFEVISAIGISTMAGITGSMAQTPVEPPFLAQAYRGDDTGLASAASSNTTTS
jgi:alkylhydroperoxidase family enzyme